MAFALGYEDVLFVGQQVRPRSNPPGTQLGDIFSLTLTLPTLAFAGAPEGQQSGEGEPQNDHRSGALQTKPIPL